MRPRVAEHWAAATFPLDLVPRFAEAGLVGRSYDTEGSPRASRLFTGFISLEASRVDPSIATFFGVHNGLAMGTLYPRLRGAAATAGCRRCCALEKIGCFGLTEPHGGSDVALGLETTARRDGDDWVLDGAKRWIGNATFADLMSSGRADVEDDQVKGFVVREGHPGFTATKMEGKTRCARCRTPTSRFDRLPDPARRTGSRAANSFRDTNRVLQADPRRGGLDRGRLPDRCLRGGRGVRQGAGAVRPADRGASS